MLTQPSTPVPLRIAKKALIGLVVVAVAYGTCSSIRDGLEFGSELTVDMALARVSGLALPRQAVAQAAPQQLAAAQPLPAAAKKPTLQKPAVGIDWGILHGNNGVDIANKCGTRISAAAAGEVVEVGSGWNGGYGNAVMIRHANGTKTHYAHLTDIDVVMGQDVEQGEMIGTMGITGKATGCHLHFEVRGGTNPFAE